MGTSCDGASPPFFLSLLPLCSFCLPPSPPSPHPPPLFSLFSPPVIAIFLDMDKWKKRYPHLASTLVRTTEMVSKLRQCPNAELEARFGVVGADGRFRTGVSRSDIDRIIHMMQTSPHITGDEEWKEEQDFLFTLNGVNHRTRVSYDSQTMQVSAETIEKSVIDTNTIRVMRCDGSSHDTDLRISLKTESPVFRLQSCVATNMVRIKQRRRFVTTCGKWAFDFSIIWSGKDKTAAEIAQSTTEPVFEVECELIDAWKILAMQSDERIACSLLLKMHDLLSNEMCTLQPFVAGAPSAS